MKSLKNLVIQYGNSSDNKRPSVHKYSIYMQSKDSTWLNRNLANGKPRDEYDEPIEEDIRD